MHSIALFGGAFDPIHSGHIKTSISVQNHYHFDSFFFVPCKTPTLKAPSLATSEQRLDMLNLAIQANPQFKIDKREIERESPSYMVETLASFRAEYPNASITLIIGFDAFLSLPQWYQWKKIITLANILVINRNVYANKTLPAELQLLLNHHKQDTKESIKENKSGIVQFYDAGDYELSSTEIRKQLKEKHELATEDLPKMVYEYIKQKALYQ